MKRYKIKWDKDWGKYIIHRRYLMFFWSPLGFLARDVYNAYSFNTQKEAYEFLLERGYLS